MAKKIYIQPLEDIKLMVGLLIREASACSESRKLECIFKKYPESTDAAEDLIYKIWKNYNEYMMHKIIEHENKKCVHCNKLFDIYDIKKPLTQTQIHF